MIRLSNRQLPMLEIFMSGQSLSIEAAKMYDQRPFRSMLIRKWINFKPGRGFKITEAGRDAYEIFMHTDIARKNPLLPLTAYFDETAYGLKKVEVIRRRKKAA